MKILCHAAAYSQTEDNKSLFCSVINTFNTLLVDQQLLVLELFKSVNTTTKTTAAVLHTIFQAV